MGFFDAMDKGGVLDGAAVALVGAEVIVEGEGGTGGGGGGSWG